jgi:hypothetical protein
MTLILNHLPSLEIITNNYSVSNNMINFGVGSDLSYKNF